MRCTSSQLAWALIGLLALCGAAACGDPEPGGARGGNPGPRTDQGDGGPPDAGDGDGGMMDATVPTTACDEIVCDPLALCNDRGGDATCSCQAGLTGDGASCDDVDECADGALNDCADTATCINSYRTYLCRCGDGQSGDGMSCTDIDECADGLHLCSPDASCENATPGYGCSCGAGFDGDGRACADSDECALGTDTCDAASERCSNRRGSYACDCAPGYADDGAGGCDTLCALADCGSGGRCAVQDDAAVCTCADGYIAAGPDCVLDAQCSSTCGPNAVCGGAPGSRSCQCAPGYEGDPRDPVDGCTPSDACQTPGLCGDHGVCVELAEGHACGCDPGYARSGGACVDIDECADGSALCDDNATCTNTDGGHDCSCNPGFTGDGLSCADVDECADGTDDCLADGTATCRNSFGGFLCGCAPGYAGDGKSGCDNLDECADDALNACDALADCEDLDPAEDPLGYRCTCQAGYVGNGLLCTLPDPCLDSSQNDCDENALCESDDTGAYTCTCADGFEGDGTQCTCPLSGYWAMRQDVQISWPKQETGGIVLIEAGSQLATVWELHRYEYDGKRITVHKKGCGSDRSPDLYSPFYEEAYGSYIPDVVFDGLDMAQGKAITLAQTDAVPGHSYTTPSEAALVGLDLPDAENSPWPGKREDIGETAWGEIDWVDVEGDGMPGMTVWQRSALTSTTCGSTGLECNYSYPAVGFEAGTTRIAERTACVSLASRVITHEDAVIDSCDRITGDFINESTEVRVYGCGLADDWEGDADCSKARLQRMRTCNRDQDIFLDGQSQDQVSSATFELLRIADLDAQDVDCPDVRDALPAIPRP